MDLARLSFVPAGGVKFYFSSLTLRAGIAVAGMPGNWKDSEVSSANSTNGLGPKENHV